VEFGTPTTIFVDNYSGTSLCKEVSNTFMFSSFEVPNFKGPYISNSEAKTLINSSKGKQISLNSLRLINNFTHPKNGKYYISTSISKQKPYETSQV
jgi:hypothetical protein